MCIDILQLEWYNSVCLSSLCVQGFVKAVKDKPYFKRYQVKFRRRRGEHERELSIERLDWKFCWENMVQ